MDPFWLLVIAIVVLIFFSVFVVGSYNRLIRHRVLVREALSGIDVQLKRRHELIPNLVAAVKGYRDFEGEVIESVTQLRRDAMRDVTVSEKQQDENRLSASLARFFAVVENYPDLKADAHFLELQEQLTSTEDSIQKTRRYYNGTVRDYNTVVLSFPSNLVATWFGFQLAEFFELASLSERDVPTAEISD